MTTTETDNAAATAIEELLAALPDDSPIRELYIGALAGPDPYPLYARMRDQGIITDQGTHISRYADALAALHHPMVSSDARNSGDYVEQIAAGLLDARQRAALDLRSFMHTDPPDHTRLRRLVAKAFTPRRVAKLRPAIQRLVDEAIDGAAGRGRMDVVADLAYPLPVQIICHLLGVPVEDHLDLADRQRTQLCCFDPATLVDTTPELLEQSRQNRDADLDYWAKVVERRRADPGDDLISALIAARDDGDRLSDDELVNTVRLLFVGGHETTVSLIANGMLALLRHPDQLRLLADRPELAGETVEETVRYDAPFQFVHRIAVGDLFINGTTIPAGTQMIIWLAAANRDPQIFPDPDAFDITRTDKRHLGFGTGIHACLGGPLARLQGEIALRTLTRRLVDPVLRTEDPPYHDDAVHALKALPIGFQDVRAARPTAPTSA